MNWQSIRSVMPPCPGIESPKSLILKVLLSPEAKKPPNGAIKEAKVANTSMWNCIGDMRTEVAKGNQIGNGYSCVRNTGFTLQLRPVQILAPRSFTGQIK